MLVVGLVLYSAWVLFGPADPNTLRDDWFNSAIQVYATALVLSLIHISEPTRPY